MMKIISVFVLLFGLAACASVPGKTQVGKYEQCDLCKGEMGILMQPEKLNWIAKMIVPLVCATLGPLSDKCMTFMDKEVGKFINETCAKGPEWACIQMGSCPPLPTTAAPVPPTQTASVDSLLKVQKFPAVVGVTESAQCDLCLLGCSYLQAILGDRSIETQIQTLFDQFVCPQLPAALTKTCDDLINQALPSIINALVTNLTGDKLCYVAPSPGKSAPCVH